jgi:hypothetical protein
MAYWDSSAVLGLCVHSRSSAALQRFLREDPRLAVWWGTPVEVATALAGLAREGLLSAQGLLEAQNRLHVLLRSCTEVLPSERLRGFALAYLRRDTVRSDHAFELAAAMVWSGEEPRQAAFVCDDDLLAAAATEIGFSVRGVATTGSRGGARSLRE